MNAEAASAPAAPGLGADGPLGAGLTITPMAVDDLDAVLAIEARSFPHPWPRQSFLDELGRARCVVLRRDGRVVGYLVHLLVGGEAEILVIAVDPEARGRGLGRALLTHLVSPAGGAPDVVHLEVRRSNAPAIALYRATGFEVVATRRAYYNDGEDALVMRWSRR